MATKIIKWGVSEPAPTVSGLSGYQKAYIYCHLHGRPVTTFYLPVVDGSITAAAITTAFEQENDWPLCEQLLHKYVGWEEPDPDPLPSATVAVCTRERPDDLARCLEGFLALLDDGQDYLIVDNAPSTDATEQVVDSFSDRFNGRLRYIREERPGLNFARNCALRHATGEIVAFNDDDAVPDSKWLRMLLRNFTDTKVMCVTGFTTPLELETAAQEVFECLHSFTRGFARKRYSRTTLHPALAGRVGAGVNMALRKSTIDHVGPFVEALDVGTPALASGDTEMFARIIRCGYHIVYEPAAVSWHRHRRTWAELRRTVYGYGVGSYAMWTHQLLYDRDWAAPLVAVAWLLRQQLSQRPIGLRLSELRGCLTGPLAYFRSRRYVGGLTVPHPHHRSTVACQPPYRFKKLQ